MKENLGIEAIWYQQDLRLLTVLFDFFFPFSFSQTFLDVCPWMASHNLALDLTGGKASWNLLQ